MSNLPDYPIGPEYVEGSGGLGLFYYLVHGSPHKDVESYLFSLRKPRGRSKVTWTSESTRDQAAFEHIPLPLYTRALGPHFRTFGLVYHLLSRF